MKLFELGAAFSAALFKHDNMIIMMLMLSFVMLLEQQVEGRQAESMNGRLELGREYLQPLRLIALKVEHDGLLAAPGRSDVCRCPRFGRRLPAASLWRLSVASVAFVFAFASDSSASESNTPFLRSVSGKVLPPQEGDALDAKPLVRL